MRIAFSLRLCMIFSLLPLVACKQSGPKAKTLTTSPDAGLAVAKGGDWTVTCQSAEADTDTSTYKLAVEGAASETDEGQDVLVSVQKVQAGKSETVATREQGHGAIAPKGEVFLGFMSGVLTASPQSAKDSKASGGYSHTGVLTLAREPNVEGLKVGCNVARSGKAVPGV